MKKILALFLTLLTLVNSISATSVERLSIALSKSEGYLNPYTYSTEDGYRTLHLLYDSLFILDEDLNVIPWLVEEYSLEGNTYTFKIHDNVTFHDGQPLTTEDVKFTFEYLQQHTKSRFSAPAAAISAMEIIDETTITMTLSEPSPDFLTKPLSEMGILPKHIWETVDDPDSCDNAVGSGPYAMEKMSDGSYYILSANENYWNGAPVADQLYLPIITDATTRQTALLTGEIDTMVANLSPEVIDQFASNDRFQMYSGSGFASTMLYFNCDRTPFDQVEFRSAMAKALDLDDMVNTVMLGYATLGSQGYIHPELSAYYQENTPQNQYNPAESMEILDNLGYIDSDGDGIREKDGENLEFTVLVYASNAIRTRVAELMQTWLADVGIRLNISALDADTVDNIVWPDYVAAHDLDFDMVLWGWGSSTMSPSYMNSLWNSDLTVGSSNIGSFSSEKVDEIVTALDRETDPARRTQLVQAMQTALAEDVPAVVFFYQDLVSATSQTHDGWVSQDGAGIFNVFSLIDQGNTPQSATDSTPEAPTESATETTTQGINWIPLAALALGIGAGLVVIKLLRRKK